MTAAPVLIDRLPVLTDREFADFQSLIVRTIGIWLADIKRALLIGRLGRRMRLLGMESYAAYYQLVLQDPSEMIQMLDAITTNETRFFREPRQFELLGDTLCPAWENEASVGRRQRKLRIWSAACSSGQEPYSLAMLLHERFGAQSWNIQIFGSDISTKVLDQARRGAWPAEKVTDVPALMRQRYLMKGTGDELRVTAQIRTMVELMRLNLQDDVFPFTTPFDAIFCRNVLIYFEAPTRAKVIAKLLDNLAPGGYLFLGHAESLAGTSFKLRVVAPAVYQKI